MPPPRAPAAALAPLPTRAALQAALPLPLRRPRRRPLPLPLALPLAGVILLALGGCSSGPAGAATPAPPAPARGPGEGAVTVGDLRPVDATGLGKEQVARFATAWHLFVVRSPRWPEARDAWLAEGGAAPYLLSENLFRYFWSASRVGRRDEILRVAAEAAVVGEPAAGYFAQALVTDRWPLREPVTCQVFNPDDPEKPLERTFTHYNIDDPTRQHAAQVLAAIGPPAVPLLTSPQVVGAALPSARRYAFYALGAIADDPAVAALGRALRTAPDWQDRGAAAKGLGFALRRNPAARAHLEAALEDPDDFVKRKAEEGLTGRTRLEF